MKRVKTIVATVVAFLFVSMAFSSVTGADESVTINKLNIIMQGVDGDDCSIEMQVTQEELNQFNNSLCDVLDLVDTTMDENSPKGKDISDSEWEIIENAVNGLLDFIKTIAGDDFQVEEVKAFLGRIIDLLAGVRYYFRQPVISIGVGITWLPFYEYETALGRFFKPVFLQHLLGFSATFKLNPFVQGFPCVKYALHRVRTFFFQGILINFGDLGVNRIIGPQLLIGFGYFTGFA